MRFKIITSAVLLIMILMLAATMSVREFNRINTSIDKLFENKQESINLSRRMIDATEQEETDVLVWLLDDNYGDKDKAMNYHTLMIETLRQARNNISEDNEGDHIERIERDLNKVYASVQYVLLERNKVDGLAFYQDSLKENFHQVRSSIINLINLNQNAIYNQSINTKVNTQRALMPILISIFCAILFIILFTYFLMIYVVRPINQITDDVRSFDIHNDRLETTVDSNNDIREMIYEYNNLIERLRVKQ